MIILSSLPKLDSFQIAEAFHRDQMLTHIYTGFASQKKRFINKVIKRRDVENIPSGLITDFWFLLLMQRLYSTTLCNELFDQMVSASIKNRDDYKAVLAWSGMAEKTMIAAKRKNKFVMLGRGSCHIVVQNEILSREYKKFGINFHIDKRTIDKELKEYNLADKIYVCSSFVRNSFVAQGVNEEKLYVNPIPVSSMFSRVTVEKEHSKFVILFLGKLTVRKGVTYLFQALDKLTIPDTEFEVWFVGASDEIILKEYNKARKNNWRNFGFVPQTKLAAIISQADVGVFPSIEDGFAQVVPQQLACGVPVIATSTTGSSDYIVNGQNGFVVPPYDSDAIAARLMQLYSDSELLRIMKINAEQSALSDLHSDVVYKKLKQVFKSAVG